MVFPWSNPGLNVSKLFNELVRVPRMGGKLIIVEKPPARPRTIRFPLVLFQLTHRSCLMVARSHVNSVTGHLFRFSRKNVN